MNSFDIIVYLALTIAIVLGFRSGLLRSAITILGYLVAAPIAIWITGLVLPQAPAGASQVQNSLTFFAIFLIAGILLGSLLRLAINDLIGAHISIGDRLGGALLGAIRIGLIAVTLVLIFDQLVPANAQPSYHRLASAPAAVAARPDRHSLIAAGCHRALRTIEARATTVEWVER